MYMYVYTCNAMYFLISVLLLHRYPVILRQFCLNSGSGGNGQYRGGDGVVRELLFRKPLTLSVLSERRVYAPYGLYGRYLIVISILIVSLLQFHSFSLWTMNRNGSTCTYVCTSIVFEDNFVTNFNAILFWEQRYTCISFWFQWSS